METKKNYIIAIIMIIIIYACKEEPSLSSQPAVTIYKTKSDYFNNVHTIVNDGKACFIQDLIGKVIVESDGTLNYKFRARLRNGYILSFEEGIKTAYLKFTIEEYYKSEKNGIVPTMTEIQESIIDADPFIEFYSDSGKTKIFGMGDTARINEIILNGELEKYFKKVK